MGCVCLEIRTVSFLGRLRGRVSYRSFLEVESSPLRYLVQIVVLRNQLLQLCLHIDNLLCGELKLHHRNAGVSQMLQETNFRRLQEQKTAAAAIGTSSGTANTMDVVARVIRRIKLDDPVDFGNLSCS